MNGVVEPLSNHSQSIHDRRAKESKWNETLAISVPILFPFTETKREFYREQYSSQEYSK